MPDDLVKTLESLAAGATVTTQMNRQLPSQAPVTPIPARSGSGSPTLL